MHGIYLRRMWTQGGILGVIMKPTKKIKDDYDENGANTPDYEPCEPANYVEGDIID